MRHCSDPNCRREMDTRKCPRCEARVEEHPAIAEGTCSNCGASWSLSECDRCGADLVPETLASLVGEDPPELSDDCAMIFEEWQALGCDENGRPLLAEQEAMLARLELDPVADRSERELRIGLWRMLTISRHEFTPDPTERNDADRS